MKIDVQVVGDFAADLAPTAVVRTEQDLIDATVESLLRGTYQAEAYDAAGAKRRNRARKELRKIVEVVSLQHLIVRVGTATFALIPPEACP